MTENVVRISSSRDAGAEAFKQTNFFTASGEFKNLKGMITQRVWSPIVWKDGVRKKDNFLSSGLIVGDSDSPNNSIDETIKILKHYNLTSMIGTTKSHQKVKGKEAACDRFRVLLPTSTICSSLDDFEYTMKLFIENMGWDISCKDGGRFYYPCSEVVFEHSGIPASWLGCPEDETGDAILMQNSKYYADKYRDKSTWPSWLVMLILKGIPFPGRHVATYKIGCFFAHTGWTEDECYQSLVDDKSPLLEIGEKDVRRCIRNAFEKIGVSTAKIIEIRSRKTPKADESHDPPSVDR